MKDKTKVLDEFIAGLSQGQLATIMQDLRDEDIVLTKEAIRKHVEANYNWDTSDRDARRAASAASKGKGKKGKPVPSDAEALAYFKAKAYKAEFSSSLYYAAITPTARVKLGTIGSAKAINLYMVLSFNVDTDTGLTHSFVRQDVGAEIGVPHHQNYIRLERKLLDAGLIELHDQSRGWTASTRYLLVDLKVWKEETVKVISAYERKFGKPDNRS